MRERGEDPRGVKMYAPLFCFNNAGTESGSPKRREKMRKERGATVITFTDAPSTRRRKTLFSSGTKKRFLEKNTRRPREKEGERVCGAKNKKDRVGRLDWGKITLRRKKKKQCGRQSSAKGRGKRGQMSYWTGQERHRRRNRSAH